MKKNHYTFVFWAQGADFFPPVIAYVHVDIASLGIWIQNCGFSGYSLQDRYFQWGIC